MGNLFTTLQLNLLLWATAKVSWRKNRYLKVS